MFLDGCVIYWDPFPDKEHSNPEAGKAFNFLAFFR